MKDSEQLDASVADFIQAMGILVRRVRATNDARLSLSQRSVLSRLDRNGPATISDLARAEGMKPQSMGACVAPLEEQGLVSRAPDPNDRRQVILTLTEAGAAWRAQTRAARQTWLAEVVARLDPAEQRTLFAATEIMRRLGEG